MAKDWYKYLDDKSREAAEKYETELKKLQDEARKHARMEAKFWKEIDSRRDEVAEHLGVSSASNIEADMSNYVARNEYEKLQSAHQTLQQNYANVTSKLNETLNMYGCGFEEFFNYVQSQNQVGYYRDNH